MPGMSHGAKYVPENGAPRPRRSSAGFTQIDSLPGDGVANFGLASVPATYDRKPMTQAVSPGRVHTGRFVNVPPVVCPGATSIGHPMGIASRSLSRMTG